MYENIIHYRPFYELIRLCRGNAISLGELSKGIFPSLDRDEALYAVSVLLAIAPLARKNNMVLFPARMHMLFRGIKGVYACANSLCSHSHSHKSLTLGEIFLNDGHMTCPECGSVVYELYNDRRSLGGYLLYHLSSKSLSSAIFSSFIENSLKPNLGCLEAAIEYRPLTVREEIYLDSMLDCSE